MRSGSAAQRRLGSMVWLVASWLVLSACDRGQPPPQTGVGVAISSMVLALDSACAGKQPGDYCGNGCRKCSATLDCTESAGTCFVPSAPTWSVTTNPNWYLHDIWGAAANDVWAVGDNGLTAHWNGTTWTEVPTGFADYNLNCVWGSSPNNVWAAGEMGALIHWDGTAWSAKLHLPTSQSLLSMWGSAANDIWVVGEYSMVFHYNGSTWAHVTAVAGTRAIRDVWGSAANDVWIVGDGSASGALIAHFDGNAWTQMTCPVNTSVYTVWGSSAQDVWFAGQYGRMLHWDGTWLLATSTITSSSLRTLWGNASNHLWAGGDNGALLRWDGSSWSAASSGTADAVFNLWGNAANDIWGVAGTNKFIHATAAPCTSHEQCSASSNVPLCGGGTCQAQDGLCLVTPIADDSRCGTLDCDDLDTPCRDFHDLTSNRCQGLYQCRPANHPSTCINKTEKSPGDYCTGCKRCSATLECTESAGVCFAASTQDWTPVPSGVTYRISSIHGRSSDDVWAVDFSDVLHWNGTAWSAVAHFSTVSVSAIFEVSAKDVWAVGYDSVVRHWDGMTWAVRDIPWSGVDLSSVWAAGPDDVWVAGTTNPGSSSYPRAFHWNGSAWSSNAPGGNGINAMWGSASNDIWTAGDNGSVAHWNGTSWYTFPSRPTMYTLTGIHGTGPNDVWAVGNMGTVVHWDGSSWAVVPTPAGTTNFNAVWSSAPGDAWVVGYNGVTLHWDGHTWSSVTFPTTSRLFSVWGHAANDVWAGSDTGELFHTTISCSDAQCQASSHLPVCATATCQPTDGLCLATALPDDDDCGTIDCDLLDTGCHDYHDIVANRCAGAGQCKTANSKAWCTDVTHKNPGDYCGSCKLCDADLECTTSAGTCFAVNTPTWSAVGNPSPTGFGSVYAAARNDAYAVSESGVLHWDGVQWSMISVGGISSARDVHGSSSKDVWVVGAVGKAAHWNGSAWSTMSAAGPGDNLNTVWIRTPSDAWAVGDNGVIVHWDGTVWTPMASNTTTRLWGVWGSAANDVWAVGDNATILHYDGNGWSVRLYGTGFSFTDIWGSSTNDIWAVGSSGYMLHWNGSAWKFVQLGSSPPTFQSIWGTSANDVWAVGYAGSLYHWNGTAWSAVSSGTNATLNDVGGTSPNDVWAVGEAHVILHTGSTCADDASCTSSSNLPVCATATCKPEDGLCLAIALTDDNRCGTLDCSLLNNGCRDHADITTNRCEAVGQCKPPNTPTTCTDKTEKNPGDYCGMCRTCDAQLDCTVQAGVCYAASFPTFATVTSGTSARLNAVWASSPYDAWAVGASGTLLHWNGRTWTAFPSGTTNELFAVWGSGPHDVYAVGANGTVLHWDGHTWSSISLTTYNVYAVSGTSANDVWILDFQAVFHWNGTAWTQVPTGTTELLYDLWASAPNSAVAVGRYGVMVQWNGTAWSTVGTSSRNFQDVWGSANDLWALDNGGGTNHWNGTTWTWVATPSYPLRYDIWGSNTRDVWAVGQGGNIIHWDGSAWSNVASGTTQTLRGFWGTGTNEYWAVGDNGVIVHGLAACTSNEQCRASSNTPLCGTGTCEPVDGLCRAVAVADDSRCGTLDCDALDTGCRDFHDVTTNRCAALGQCKEANIAGTCTDRTEKSPGDYCGGCRKCDEVLECTDPMGTCFTVASPAWTPWPSGTTAELFSAWGSGPKDIWAVGDSGTTVHFNGTAWSTINSGATNGLASAWGSASNNLWAVGQAGTVLQWNGTTWSAHASVTANRLNSVWGSFATDVWAVGDAGTVQHFNGTAWSLVDSGVTVTLNGVWCSSPTDAWAVGANGTILRWNGTTWASVTSGTTATLNGVWGSSANDVWVVGNGGTLLRWNGSAWSMVTSGTAVNLNGVWGSSLNDVWVTGSNGTLRHWNGVSWLAVTSGTGSALRGAWGSAANDVWAVGAGGVIVHHGNASCSGDAQCTSSANLPLCTTASCLPVDGLCLVEAAAADDQRCGNVDCDGLDTPCRDFADLTTNRCAAAGQCKPANDPTLCTTRTDKNPGDYCGGCKQCDADLECTQSAGVCFAVSTSWSAVPSGTSNTLRSIWGIPGQRAIAVGTGGTTLAMQNGTWSAMTNAMTSTLHSVWGSSSSDVWAVGENSTVVHWDGTQWQSVGEPPSSLTFRGVWASAPNDVWVVGDSGSILHWDGQTWLPRGLGMVNIMNVWGVDANDVWAVGEHGTILHWNGSEWAEVPSGTDFTITAVWGSATHDVWAVGEQGTILHWNGTTWSPVAANVNIDLWDIDGNSAIDAFAVGDGGTILHWNGSAWSAVTSGTSKALHGVWSASVNDVWTVGQDGIMLHMTAPACANNAQCLASTNFPLCASTSCMPVDGLCVAAAVADDERCGTVDCDALDNPCRDFHDLTVNRCTMMGQCKVSNSLSTCTHETSKNPGDYCGGCMKCSAALDCTELAGTCYRKPFSWSVMPPVTSSILWDVWGSAANDVWAVGDNGTILRWNGTEWSSVSSGTDAILYGVWGSASDDVWAVGAFGAILHWNGTSWSPVEGGMDMFLLDVWGSSRDDVWIAGDSGRILHWNGSVWTEQPGVTQNQLYSVRGTSASDVWMVGMDSTILHWDGNGWTSFDSVPGLGLVDVYLASSTDGWATSWNGIILRWDGDSWSNTTISNGGSYFSVFGDINSAWAVGGFGDMRKWNRNAWRWEEVPSVTWMTLNHVWGISMQDIWIVGDQGTILHGLSPSCADDADCTADPNRPLCGDATCQSLDGVCVSSAVVDDDQRCGTLDCSGLDTACRHHAPSTSHRCAAVGSCHPANSAAACTQFTNEPANTHCAECKACNTQGECATVLEDDDVCGTVDCDELDTLCQQYDDLNTRRCTAEGACKVSNQRSSCDVFTLSPSGSACGQATCTGSILHPAGACGADDHEGLCMVPDAVDCAPYTCVNGACAILCVTEAECASGNTCLSGVCQPRKLPGNPCASPSECTTNVCSDGVCCNEACGDVCRSCTVPGSVGTCAFVPAGLDDRGDCASADGCGFTCNGQGACTAVQPGQSCGSCHVCQATNGCQPVANGTSCDGEVYCLLSPTCQDGSCTGGTPRSCNDDNVCTADACDEVADICTHTARSEGLSCSDGNACNGEETCHQGVCLSAGNGTCDDQNPCTQDSCDASNGNCTHTPVADRTPCLDGNLCNGMEECRAGVCQEGTSLDCDDHESCTQDGCNPASGCTHAALPDDETCADDGTSCTMDRCQGGLCKHVSVENGTPCQDVEACGGTCQGGTCQGGLDCGDGDPCTVDVCNASSQTCAHQPAQDNTPCSDSDVCNGAETCRGGQCTPGTPLSCDDNNPCTVEVCDPVKGCDVKPVNDGTSCSTATRCGGQCVAGACQGGTAIDCDDANPCTADGCDSVSGHCTHTPANQGGVCDDGNFCTEGTVCNGGVCGGGTAVDCGDNNPCTVDSCDPVNHCRHTATVGERCNDGNQCTDNDACQSDGRCVGQNIPSCGVSSSGPVLSSSRPVSSSSSGPSSSSSAESSGGGDDDDDDGGGSSCSCHASSRGSQVWMAAFLLVGLMVALKRALVRG